MRTATVLLAALLVNACSRTDQAPWSEPSSGGATGGEATAVVAPIPPGYHAITPYLVVRDLPAAIAFAERAFGAVRTELIEAPDGTALHAEVRIGDSIVMLGPENAERQERSPATLGGTNGALLVYVEDTDAAFARALEAGATEVMPPADMFWGDRYAQVEDASGHRWSIATYKVVLTDEEVDRRAQLWMEATGRGEPPPAFEGGTPATSHQRPGFFTVTPSLTVRGPADLDFYRAAFGATEEDRMLAGDQLMHGEIRIGDSPLFLSGEMPEMDERMKTPEHLGGAPLGLMLYVEDADAAFARAVGAGATARMPVTEVFWGDRFGQVADPAAHLWGIATRVRNVTPEQIRAAIEREHAPPAEQVTAP
jgi:uncharacterized glyoxalase superfamily protein PhnB